MGDIDTLVLPPNSGYRAGVAVENVHAKGTRGEKVLQVCLGLQSSEVEHSLAVEFDKLEGALHVDIPFEGVLRESESVHLRGPEDFGNARLNSRWPGWVELDDLGNQILVVLVFRQRERLMPELGNRWSGSDVDQEGDIGARAVLKHWTIWLVVQAVVHRYLGETISPNWGW